MASYYFLMSSLPMLKSDGMMPITYSKFFSYCKDAVSQSTYDRLENLTLDSTEGRLIKEWSMFYSFFKEQLNYQRSKKLNIPAAQPFDEDVEVTKIIISAVNDDNPLNAEETLMAALFDKLDSLIGIHTFDDYALFGYALKLKLLERKTVFDDKTGKAEFNRLVKGLEEQIRGIH